MRCVDIGFGRMVQVLGLMGMIVSMITGAVTGSLTALETNFGLSTFELGLIVVSYDIGAVLAAMPYGFLGSRNPPRWIGVGAVAASASIFLFGTVSSFSTLFTFHALTGAGATVVWILGPVHVDNNVHCKAVASDYTGWLMAFAPFGVVGGLILTGVFLDECETSSEGSNDCTTFSPEASVPEVLDCDQWRYPMWILACALAPFEVWFFFSKKQYPTPATAACCGEVELLPESEWGKGQEVTSDLRRGVAALLGNPRYVFIVFGSIIYSFQATAVISFGPRYIEKQLCVQRSEASMLTGTLVPMICFGSYMGGYIPKRMGWGLATPGSRC